ncbi:hypothetical protein [Streptomyces sp. AC1-42T]|uniref:hypothetical protein n=1 Tax=Streptomyces sp. AC1-42T TaxID=2218665 RepID=UPI000DAE31F9|nr:hypothetical protein [Streptomyces sp. AC1-42T]PZT71418.1 hypothetical protein DNK55_32410 [Streptomyces sp. AC1-42T]
MSQLNEAPFPADYAAQLIREVFRRGGRVPGLTTSQVAAVAQALDLKPPVSQDVADAVIGAVTEPVRWEDSNQRIAEAVFGAANNLMPFAVEGALGKPSVLMVPVVLVNES